MPFFRPRTTHVVSKVVAQVAPSGREVTTYPVVNAALALTVGIQETTETWLKCAVAETAVTASGALRICTGGAGSDPADDPIAFVAVTVKT